MLDLINEYKGELLYDTSFKDIVKSKLKNCSKKPYSLFDLFTGDISFKSNNQCDIPKNDLLRLNEQNLIFLSENNDMSYRDKIKLLIVFEQRLTLLSKYFSLEVLRRKNKTHSDVKKLLKKISQLDTNQNKRELDMVKQLKNSSNG